MKNSIFKTEETTIGVSNLDTGAAFVMGKDYYVLSGLIPHGRRFYQKTICRNYRFITAILTYREEDKAQYEPLIDPVFSTLN